ncbi:putative HXXXD-type acyl-transferase family protein [Hibiscus syriacus]|uniref:HXXXD-type acyl-transferase family protein n=1 Tax=Hibiscus syriacus TaxID=106335 RepID=A0A6A3CE26_HIBSY|nr:putative HXXXD-type acyl-transferase family protein [Hibiscus syriacus]
MANGALTVEIVGRYCVSPPPNTVPPTSLPLTFFDIPWLFFSPTQPLFFFDYPFPSSHFLSTALPQLIHSLSLTLQRFSPLAASLLCPPHSSTPLIVYKKSDFVSLLVAQSNADFFHLSSNHQRSVNDFYPLLPPIPSKEEGGIPLLAAQVTVFSKAGICIGFAYHNVVADGRTFNGFIKTWASLFKDPSSSSSPLPFYDRSVIKDCYGLHSIFLNHWSSSRTSSQRTVIGVSDSDSVSAMLTSKNPSYFGFNAGGLTRLDYPIPTTYFANAVGSKVKELDEAFLDGAEDWISDWAVFHGPGSEPHVMVSGSPKLDSYETDFGWGRARKIEEISIDSAKGNAVSFTESRDVKGGIEHAYRDGQLEEVALHRLGEDGQTIITKNIRLSDILSDYAH